MPAPRIIRSREPHPRDRDEAKEIRLGYYAHIAAEPLPSIAVIQDIDVPDYGFGAFWGEVQSNVHKGLGCVGVITDGSVRDLDAMAPEFFVLAGSIMPSHAHVHLVDFGGTVSVAGMVVSANDVIHADRHGAVVVPAEAVKEIPRRPICSRAAKRSSSTLLARPASRSPGCARPSTSRTTSTNTGWSQSGGLWLASTSCRCQGRSLSGRASLGAAIPRGRPEATM